MFCIGSLEVKIDNNAKAELPNVVTIITLLLSYWSEKYPIGPWPNTPAIVAINNKIEVSNKVSCARVA